MALLAQHGYGKSTKIDDALAGGHLAGVVMSPRDEMPDRLADYLSTLRSAHGDAIDLLVDPQFYATNLTPVNDGKLPEYSYYRSGLSRRDFIAQVDIQSYVSDVLQFEHALPVSYLVSPNILLEDFADPWSQIALTLCQESVAFHSGLVGAQPLLLSLVFAEEALRDRGRVDDFLDIVSTFEAEGFYLVMRVRDSGYPSLPEESSFGNLLYAIYSLSELNGYRVICGYSDLASPILQAVGATHTCTGWFNSLRQFSLERFRPSTGGQPRRHRYSARSLMNSVLILPELRAMEQTGQIGSVLSNNQYDSVFGSGDPAAVDWPLALECLHHWDVLAGQGAALGGGNVSSKLDVVTDMIDTALGLYDVLQRAGVVFEAASGPRNLVVWGRALDTFRTDFGI